MTYHLRPLPLRSPVFWTWAIIAMAIGAMMVAWEGGAFAMWVWSPPRPPIELAERLVLTLLIVLLGLVAGLMGVRIREGSCPRGVRRATSIAGALGALSLLCPVCLALPIGLFGGAVTLALLSPFAPLMRLLAILVLAWTAILLLHERR